MSPGEERRAGVLVVGNYCHDVLFRDGRVIGNSLGGAASFVSNVLLDPLCPLPSHYVSKVGPDFAYTVSHPPIITADTPTTLFHAHFSSNSNSNSNSNRAGDRLLNRLRACDPISPSDLPTDAQFDFGLAVGVAGEISPDTLSRMLDLCTLVFVDAQALIRTFDPIDGTVGLVPLRDTGFYHLLPRIGFLKVSAVEAPFVDVEEVRKCCCILITQGEDGCRVYWKDGELHVPPFPAVEMDPTGAGDTFLGGFLLGLLRGFKVQDAALLGNFFGSLTVTQIGIPKFDQRMLQRIKQALDGVTVNQCVGLCGRNGEVDFQKSDVHEGLRVSLTEAAKLICSTRSSGDQLAEGENGGGGGGNKYHQKFNFPFCLG